jgi:hypothetical protein
LTSDGWGRKESLRRRRLDAGDMKPLAAWCQHRTILFDHDIDAEGLA